MEDPDDNNNNRYPFYFFYVNEVDLTAEFDTADDYNHKIKAGQSYLSGHYLEEITHKTKKGGYLYYVDDNKTVFVFKECIVYPFVQFEEIKISKKQYLFLANEEYCEIIYFIEETKMGALISHK